MTATTQIKQRIRYPDVVLTAAHFVSPRVTYKLDIIPIETWIQQNELLATVVYHALRVRPTLSAMVVGPNKVHFYVGDEQVGIMNGTFSRRSGRSRNQFNAIRTMASTRPSRARSEEEQMTSDWKRAVRHIATMFTPKSDVDLFREHNGSSLRIASMIEQRRVAPANTLDAVALVAFVSTLRDIPPHLAAMVTAYREAEAAANEIKVLASDRAKSVVFLPDAVLINVRSAPLSHMIERYALDAVPARYSNALALRIMPKGEFIPGVGVRIDETSGRFLVNEEANVE